MLLKRARRPVGKRTALRLGKYALMRRNAVGAFYGFSGHPVDWKNRQKLRRKKHQSRRLS
jgi:hypothetical protein